MLTKLSSVPPRKASKWVLYMGGGREKVGEFEGSHFLSGLIFDVKPVLNFQVY